MNAPADNLPVDTAAPADDSLLMILPPGAGLPIPGNFELMDDDEQRTAHWYRMRAGRFTGSKFVDVIARNKKTQEPLKAYHDLIWQIIVERKTGEPQIGASAIQMQWGTDCEPAALAAISEYLGQPIQQTGFIVHPQCDYAGASPDGLIGTAGGLEIKCPYDSAVHLSRFHDGMPDEYMPQCQGAMWVTGRQWWVFASFDPRMPLELQLYLQLVPRDEDMIARIQSCVIEAELLVQERMAKLAAQVDKVSNFALPTLTLDAVPASRPAPALDFDGE